MEHCLDKKVTSQNLRNETLTAEGGQLLSNMHALHADNRSNFHVQGYWQMPVANIVCSEEEKKKWGNDAIRCAGY